MSNFLFDGPSDAKVTILLAHGAGVPMDTASMSAFAQALAFAGLRVARFEFDYMAARRVSAARRPPPLAEKLMAEYCHAVDELKASGPLIIGGKSMGGRVASMVADELFVAKRISGLLCLGYPFHPTGKPQQLRTAHLANLKAPTLIVQGTRDPFGTRDEVESYDLAGTIELLWLEDGDHDLKPRKSISGLSLADHMDILGTEVSIWADRITQ